MANIPSFTDLSSIKPFKTTWRIQVKIIHSWKQYTQYGGETLEMILTDSAETQIHATVKKQQISKFQRSIVPGEWKIIENFTLSKDPSLDENILIDVIGQVVNIGQMKTHEVENKTKKKLEFELRNTRDARLPVTLWGSFAKRVITACQNCDDHQVTCLLRFAKVNSFKGERSVSNAFDASLLEFDPVCVEAIDFVNQLPNDGLALTIKSGVPDQTVRREVMYNRFPPCTIVELLDFNEEGKFKMMCTVYAIDRDFAWYYFTCLKYATTCFKVPKVENSVNEHNKPPLFWCSGCKENHNRIEPRYKIILHVMDSTGQTKVCLFQNEGKLLTHKTPMELLNGQLEEIQDPSKLPQAIQSLVGKTFQFTVSIGKENIRAGNDTYKVAYAFVGLEDNDLTNTQLSNEVDDLATIVSGDQTFMISNTDDSIQTEETCKTPCSKRKDEVSLDVPDESSSSKKLCIGNMKAVIEDVKNGADLEVEKSG
ncbi:uncharacterized protein LOC17889083 [Capsella rubella]|uniref:uncharacterized protein LOC17889083 n=1 Tax=Capsella rubella TaxID=81985 RepID=UPI000CD5A2D5|nr:uncharacterized protein LOC17889083 [Capsella rubella]